MSSGQAVVSPHAHAVSFYDQDDEPMSAVAQYVAEGLSGGERAVVVATGAHRSILEQLLREAGVDPLGAQQSGSFVPLDAAQTLDTFMVDGSPDRARFVRSVGGIIDTAQRGGSTVRVFGEMVALLWGAGNVAAAIELESMWNDLALAQTFSLLCAYPTDALGGAQLADVHRVCDLHSAVLPPMSYASPAEGRDADHDTDTAAQNRRCSVVFLPTPAAVPAARRFVLAALESWGEGALAWEAAIVASELSTNAVRHSSSPFRAIVTRTQDDVRIAIEDVGSGWPTRRDAGPAMFDGRGVAIVEAIAHRTGCDALPAGKLAWAELLATAAN